MTDFNELIPPEIAFRKLYFNMLSAGLNLFGFQKMEGPTGQIFKMVIPK